eukprot:1335619-Pleurochrysis_carterae.AAC.6
MARGWAGADLPRGGRRVAHAAVAAPFSEARRRAGAPRRAARACKGRRRSSCFSRGSDAYPALLVNQYLRQKRNLSF